MKEQSKYGSLQKFFLLLAVAATAGFTNGPADDIPRDVIRLDVKEFREHFPAFGSANKKDVTRGAKEQQVRSPLDSRSFSLVYKTDSTKVPPGLMHAQILIFENGTAKHLLDIKDFRSVSAEWIDEEILKVISWPGTCVRLVELVNVKSGAILYRSATGTYQQNI
jgi:hypothetical protein